MNAITEENASVVRVALADDHPIVRAGVRGFLSADRNIIIAGEASDGQLTIDMLRKGGIDVLVLDLAMPGRAGLSLLRQVINEAPEVRVIVFSSYESASHEERSLALGAYAYLPKDTRPAQILAKIHEVMTMPVRKRMRLTDEAKHLQLSLRQFDIFMRLVRGETVTEIARELNLSVKTVSTHKITLQKRLDADSVVDLVRYATEHDLITSSEQIGAKQYS